MVAEGPALRSTKGSLSEVITGNDYLKSSVNETYSLEAGTAHWRNNSEQGEKKISAPAFCSSLNGGPSEIALLAHAALQHGGKIALLPEGVSRIQRMTEKPFTENSQLGKNSGPGPGRSRP